MTRQLLQSRGNITTTTSRASFHQTALLKSDDSKSNSTSSAESSPAEGAIPDKLASKKFKGVTGGGEPLSSSSPNAAPQPKVSNLSVPGTKAGEGLTEEQKKEVEQHNKEFAEKHDIGNRAEEDKVNKKFWTSQE